MESAEAPKGAEGVGWRPIFKTYRRPSRDGGVMASPKPKTSQEEEQGNKYIHMQSHMQPYGEFITKAQDRAAERKSSKDEGAEGNLFLYGAVSPACVQYKYSGMSTGEPSCTEDGMAASEHDRHKY